MPKCVLQILDKKNVLLWLKSFFNLSLLASPDRSLPPHVIRTPHGPSTEADVSLYVAGGPGAKCGPVRQTGWIHHISGRDGPRADELQAEGSAHPGAESSGE